MTAKIDRPELETLAHEPATHWTQLDAELRMLCRSLSRTSGWTPEAVTTFVCLPGDVEYQQAIGTLCQRLAAEYRLEQTVRREGGDWCVRFARLAVAEAEDESRLAHDATSATRGLRVALGRASAVWRLSVAHRRGRVVVM
jgi:hypothetical protein